MEFFVEFANRLNLPFLYLVFLGANLANHHIFFTKIRLSLAMFIPLFGKIIFKNR